MSGSSSTSGTEVVERYQLSHVVLLSNARGISRDMPYTCTHWLVTANTTRPLVRVIHNSLELVVQEDSY